MSKLPLISIIAIAVFSSPSSPWSLGAAQEDGAGSWVVLEPAELRAKGGVDLEPVGDGSIRAVGKNPDQTVYEVEIDTDLVGVTALRLEALTDPSMRNGGPGRADAGNFVLSELEAWVAQIGSVAKPREVVFTDCVADFSQARYPASYAVDGKLDAATGWAVDGSTKHENRIAVFRPATPFGFGTGTRLRVRMSFVSSFPRHSIGRFRLSATTSTDVEQMLPTTSADQSAIDASTRRGIAWLLAHQQPDGSWAGPDMPQYYGMTALAVYTLVQSGLKSDHPAVRAARAYMEHRPMVRTYDVGCALLALRACGDPLPRDRIAELHRFLLDTMGNGTSAYGDQWGYPFGHTPTSPPNHVDLSNTQYALLGLRAGAGCGEKVPPLVWERVAKDVMKLQGDYGSFTYMRGRNPTASMTVAGIACLMICAEQLESVPGKEAVVERLRSAIALADGWLRMYWSVKENIELPRNPSSGENRWFYYYVYGLERVGSIGKRRFIGGHDWYAEGAAALIDMQRDDGSWTTAYGEADANTCFALLFLQRGTRTTEVGERQRELVAAAVDAPFDIGTNSENPLVAWVRNVNGAVRDRFGRGERVVEVEWKLGGATIASVAPAAGVDRLQQRFTMQSEVASNGEFPLVAVMRFASADGTPAGEVQSNELKVRVDGVETAFHRTAIRDGGANLIDPGGCSVEASSALDGHPPEYAIDGKAGTSWVSAAEDTAPWILLRPNRPLTGGVLKLTSAAPYLGGLADWARPKEIEVQVNGTRPIRVALADEPTIKQHVLFKEAKIRSVRVTIRSVFSGTHQARAAGFKEIELYAPDHPAELAEGSRPSPLEYVLPTKDGEAVTWRFSEKEPAGDWFAPDFDDRSWARATAPFSDRNTKKREGKWRGRELWLRGAFELRALVESSESGAPSGTYALEVKVDDTVEIYVNGVEAGVISKWTEGRYQRIVIEGAAAASLKRGSNSIAVRCGDIGGARFFDLMLGRVIEE